MNKALKCRTDVVGVFPNPESLLRLAKTVLVERDGERSAADGRYFSERSMTLRTANSENNEGQVTPPVPMTA